MLITSSCKYGFYLLFCRPGIKELLNHVFFADDIGLKLDLVSREEAVAANNSKVEFRLRVLDPKKRSNKYKENEAIQFDFDIDADNAEEVAKEMVSHLNLTTQRKITEFMLEVGMQLPF